jgi:general L-amino acid transport system permease protein
VEQGRHPVRAARALSFSAFAICHDRPEDRHMTDLPVRREKPRVNWIFHPRVRSVVIQFLLVALVALVAWFIYRTTSRNIAAQRIPIGFDFFWIESGFSISQALIPFSENNTYARAFLVGLLNTLLVSALGVIFATVIGFLVGIGRLSNNWIVSRLCGTYVEVIRNLPLLFQILFWYLAVLAALPVPRQSISLAGDVFINNRGIMIPKPLFGEGFGMVSLLALVGVLLSLIVAGISRRYRIRTGQRITLWPAYLLLVIAAPLAAFLYLGVSVEIDKPVLKGFNFNGGVRVIPEFLALLIALSTYTAGFIAEIVRAGVLAVPKGQSEAASALGLRRSSQLRLIIVPQALRVIIPPLTSQYLNLIKNSSLAVSIGYPDLVSVFAGTTLNNTGQAIEILGITMLVYLFISLLVSFGMNLYNRRIALKER